jgi:hypothetical protein
MAKASARRATAPAAEIISTGTDLLFQYGGRTIAKRGHPNTPQAGTWIPLEPGAAVYDSGDTIVVEINGVRVH